MFSSVISCAVFQVDLPGVFQPISSSNEAEGRAVRHEVNLPECSREADTGMSFLTALNLITLEM